MEWRDIMQQRDADDLASARLLPYFEGDFWTDELERQIQKLQEEEATEVQSNDGDNDGESVVASNADVATGSKCMCRVSDTF